MIDFGRVQRVDILYAALIFVGTIGYLALWPYNIGPSDEAIYLYDATRIIAGDVIYRDIFDVITPGYMYLMAALFEIFGADIATARWAQAILHGCTGVVLYWICRRLQVRPMLSWPVALAYLVIAQQAWPVASQHWLSTTFMFVVLLVAIANRQTQLRAAMQTGLALGVLNAVQQQRGLFIAVGMFAWVGLDAALERYYRQQPVWPLLRGRWLRLVGGTLIVMVPVLVGVVAIAGFAPAWRALVSFPLFEYRGTTHCPWGDVNIMSAKLASYTFPGVLKYLPLALMIPTLRALLLIARRQNETEARRLVLLIVFCVASIGSILYFPDFVHIAFIAGAFFITVAETCEWLAARMQAPLIIRRITAAVFAGLLLYACGVRLQANLVRVHADYPFERHTNFGTIALASALEADLYDVLSELMQGVPSRVLYCYPVIAHLYLMTATHNPTPYGFMNPILMGPDMIQHVLDLLKASRPPYVVALKHLTHKEDPVFAYIQSAYEPIGGTRPAAGYVYRLKESPR
jgi:hypothetical protein